MMATALPNGGPLGSPSGPCKIPFLQVGDRVDSVRGIDRQCRELGGALQECIRAGGEFQRGGGRLGPGTQRAHVRRESFRGDLGGPSLVAQPSKPAESMTG